MAAEQVESVVRRAETLLAEAVQMKVQCQEGSAQMAAVIAQLKEEGRCLREQCQTVQDDMDLMRRHLEELLDTKAAFEARERQARKLSKQL